MDCSILCKLRIGTALRRHLKWINSKKNVQLSTTTLSFVCCKMMYLMTNLIGWLNYAMQLKKSKQTLILHIYTFVKTMNMIVIKTLF